MESVNRDNAMSTSISNLFYIYYINYVFRILLAPFDVGFTLMCLTMLRTGKSFVNREEILIENLLGARH